MRKLSVKNMEEIKGGNLEGQICNGAGVLGSAGIGLAYGAVFGNVVGAVAGLVVGFTWGAACATMTNTHSSDINYHDLVNYNNISLSGN